MHIETQTRVTVGVWALPRLLVAPVCWVGQKGPLRGFHA